MSKSLIEKLSKVQKNLKAPKGQFNKFGNYAYRSCEDIMEAVKPLLAAEGLAQIVSDDVIEVGGRVYVKATIKVTDGESTVENSALAREPQDQKGMNEAQITGSASSYARKYALNGMYAIDDTKDADATNDHGKSAPVQTKTTTSTDEQKARELIKDFNNSVSQAPTSQKRSFRKTTTGSEDL